MYLWYVYKLHVHASIVACNGASYMHVYVDSSRQLASFCN